MRWMSPLLLFSLSLGCDDEGSSESAPQDGGAEAQGEVGAGGEGGGEALPAPLAAMARFEPEAEPAETGLARIPWPSEIYRDGEQLKLNGLRRGTGGLLNMLIDSLEAETRGFGTSASLYLSFTGPPELELLPKDPRESLAPDSLLQLINLEPSSPHYGERVPLRWRYRAEAAGQLPAHSLSIRLPEGLALRPKNLYLLLLSGAERSAAFEAMLSESPPSEHLALWESLAPLREWLQGSTLKPSVASVFRTQDPVSELFQARNHLHSLPPPELLEIENRGLDATERFFTLEGRYRAPRFQEGEIPYIQPGEGAIRFDADGAPIQQGEEELRFALTMPVPDHPIRPLQVPPEGWPIALYAHGTGGNYRSFIERANVASVLASRGIAAMGIDQLHHGPRANNSGLPPDFLFFNFQVPTAGRDNLRQATLDLISQMRFAQSLDLDPELAPVPLHLDPTRILFLGHSQGGLNGPLFLAVESEVLGGMLSGAGSNIAITLEQKREPYDINALIAGVLGLTQNDPLDRWHPASMLLQTFIEPGDAVNYARF